MIHLAGGVALLLWGLRMVRTGAMRAFGGDLRRILSGALSNRMAAFACGLGVTAVLQSATATALMTASFASRGLVTTAVALAVVLGADVGTAMVAQLLSFDLRWLSPVLLALGVLAFSSTLPTRWRDLGRAAVGLGLMLLALRLIVEATHPLRDSSVVHDVLAALANERLLAVILIAALTWLVHSSLAMVLLAISLADVGLLPPALALACVLGANLGGALPALVATWRGEAGARRVTIGNLIFRAVGVALTLPFLGQILVWLPLLDDDMGRQIANFHAGFNLALAIVFLPLVGIVAARLDKWIVEREGPETPGAPKYLDESALESPALALSAAARETLRMGDDLKAMLDDTLTAFRTDDRKVAEAVGARDDAIDRLCEEVKTYLLRIQPDALSDADARRSMEILQYATNLEHAGDIVEKNLIELAVKKIKNRVNFSDEGFAEIAALHADLLETLRLSLAVFMNGDLAMARRLIAEKVEFRERERAAAQTHLERLRGRNPDTIETSSLHLDVLRDLKRIHSHLVSVAYPILEAAGALRDSRLAPEKSPRRSRAKDASESPITR
ncbi:MAG: Na/Pi cotransporter family protein [Azospirillum sp.]|nr:Na/Pi cotransporter family protein [Azospirillum sp.]MCZ8122580.1 Na/Pi cotransporter family protein [Magnetospirillum sp.]